MCAGAIASDSRKRATTDVDSMATLGNTGDGEGNRMGHGKVRGCAVMLVVCTRFEATYEQVMHASCHRTEQGASTCNRDPPYPLPDVFFFASLHLRAQVDGKQHQHGSHDTQEPPQSRACHAFSTPLPSRSTCRAESLYALTPMPSQYQYPSGAYRHPTLLSLA